MCDKAKLRMLRKYPWHFRVLAWDGGGGICISRPLDTTALPYVTGPSATIRDRVLEDQTTVAIVKLVATRKKSA